MDPSQFNVIREAILDANDALEEKDVTTAKEKYKLAREQMKELKKLGADTAQFLEDLLAIQQAIQRLELIQLLSPSSSSSLMSSPDCPSPIPSTNPAAPSTQIDPTDLSNNRRKISTGFEFESTSIQLNRFNSCKAWF